MLSGWIIGIVLLLLLMFIAYIIISSTRYTKKYKNTKYELVNGDLLTDEEYEFLKKNNILELPLCILTLKIAYVIMTKHNIKIGSYRNII